MRSLGSLLAVGLSTIAVATASSLPSRDVSSIYYKHSSKNPSGDTDIPTLSRPQFTLALAHRLGLSQFHSLTQQDDVDAIMKIDAVVPGAEFLGGNGKGKLVVHISNVQREMFSGIKPTFNVDSKQAPVDQSTFNQVEEYLGAGLQPEWILDANYDTTDRIEVLSNSFVCNVPPYARLDAVANKNGIYSGLPKKIPLHGMALTMRGSPAWLLPRSSAN